MLTRSRRDFLASAGRGFGAVAASSLLPPAFGATAPLAPKTPHQAAARQGSHLSLHARWRQPCRHLGSQTGTGTPLRQDVARQLCKGSEDQPHRFHESSGARQRVAVPQTRAIGHRDLGPVSQHGRVMPMSLCWSARAMATPLIMLRRCICMRPVRSFPANPASARGWSMASVRRIRTCPAFVVMTDGAMKCGPQGYGAGFLPAVYQGTMFRSGKSPVLDLANPEGISNATQRATLDLVGDLDRQHLAERPYDSDLEARLASYELAFRMQSEAPGRGRYQQRNRSHQAPLRHRRGTLG